MTISWKRLKAWTKSNTPTIKTFPNHSRQSLVIHVKRDKQVSIPRAQPTFHTKHTPITHKYEILCKMIFMENLRVLFLRLYVRKWIIQEKEKRIYTDFFVFVNHYWIVYEGYVLVYINISWQNTNISYTQPII